MVPPDTIEALRPDLPRGGFRAALFDFDGTLSLIRGDWPRVMIPMMVEVLRATGTGESEEALTALVDEFVMQLNGRPSIDQMARLADEVRRRGGAARSAEEYKAEYLDRLMRVVGRRTAEIESGRRSPADWALPGTHAFLDELRRRGLVLYLASGTDEEFVRREAALLRLTDYFGPRIFAATPDGLFSKRGVVERMLRENAIRGEQLLGFGDGVVEIEEVKRAGGVAVAVAFDDERGEGVSGWKRERLVEAGADVVIADYRAGRQLISWLFGEN
jgi:phosphoglycolate phosphatase-like HAD superfamily hydrolase